MDFDIPITPGPSGMSSQESYEGGGGLSSHEDDSLTGGPARKRSRKDKKMSSTDEKIEIMVKEIAKTKRIIESLSPLKLTSRVERDRHEEWIVHDELVDDAFEAPESSIERASKPMQEHEAVVNSVSTLASSARDPLFKWESDETLGDQATYGMILYANQNHSNLKIEYPIWVDRIKQIAKIWKNLTDDKRQPYVKVARENRTASLIKKQVKKYFINITYPA